MKDRVHILVEGSKTGLPYSKGLMASSILATGLSPASAYRIAEELEERLFASGTAAVDVTTLRETVVELLRERVGDDAATRYLTWQRVQDRNRPLMLLIGGATGVGKSTVAAQVATRLGITRIVSTDAIREVMRATVSRDLLPHLHVSSFEAVEAQEHAPTSVAGATALLLTGFLRQTQAVNVGIEQILRRSVTEHTDTVVEGVHLVPGITPLPEAEDAIVVQLVLSVDDEDLHRDNLTSRGQESRRPRNRYLERFREIRLIQEEVVQRAAVHGVPRVRSWSLDTTVDEVTSLVVRRVSEVRSR